MDLIIGVPPRISLFIYMSVQTSACATPPWSAPALGFLYLFPQCGVMVCAAGLCVIYEGNPEFLYLFIPWVYARPPPQSREVLNLEFLYLFEQAWQGPCDRPATRRSKLWNFFIYLSKRLGGRAIIAVPLIAVLEFLYLFKSRTCLGARAPDRACLFPRIPLFI